jgi:hypothetical protein
VPSRLDQRGAFASQKPPARLRRHAIGGALSVLVALMVASGASAQAAQAPGTRAALGAGPERIAAGDPTVEIEIHAWGELVPRSRSRCAAAGRAG